MGYIKPEAFKWSVSAVLYFGYFHLPSDRGDASGTDRVSAVYFVRRCDSGCLFFGDFVFFNYLHYFLGFAFDVYRFIDPRL